MKLAIRMFFFFSFIFISSFSLSTYAAQTDVGKKPTTEVAVSSVNINSADAEVLATVLTGVGTKRAQSIVAYRKANGPFKSIDELKFIKGIGDSIIKKNRGRIKL